MKSVPKVLRELKSKEETDVIWKACCDVLRALTILHGSAWNSDLTMTLNELWRMEKLSEERISSLQGKVEDALGILNGKGIVISQKRMRADLSRTRPIAETLHSAPDFVALLREFGGDKEVLRYRREVMGYHWEG